jgi:hypothetical protein
MERVVAHPGGAHHDLCWGCGAMNPFGLHLELAFDGERVRGRFFVKQDLQGPDGRLHDGVLAGALHEALTRTGPVASVALRFTARAAVGTFVEVEAGGAEALARSAQDGAVLATARTAVDG